MGKDIAIIGLACEFPGARTPEELFATAATKRRWFRRIPSCRLGAGYQDVTGNTPDTTRLQQAALLEGYAFPLGKFALGAKDILAADFAHWLALDCAVRAWEDAGATTSPPRGTTRIIVGNTLAGETSRAELLRLRWPYVRKTMEECGWDGDAAEWNRREQFFKARLSPVDGRTLAGALSNVIAGRIAGFLDTRGGAYCVDAACASSLVAVTQACSQLASGEIDCCIAGGVDVSLDPLELVGFSVAGALAEDRMRIFDRGRAGFLPGEGCGFAILMRAEDALAAGHRVRAIIRGWAMSSDGRHDVTAPSAEGQRLVLERTYAMAGYGIGSVPLFEAHGTGTVVGDQVEINALQAALKEAPLKGGRAAAIGSIKANIGHTKAAAGMAGLIKAVLALETGVIPPVTGCENPMPEFGDADCRLRLPDHAEAWPEGAARRAGVSAFGFGGVNVHLTLEAADAPSGQGKVMPPPPLAFQDAEIFLFDGRNLPDLRRRVEKVKSLSPHLAAAELAPVAAATLLTLKSRCWRAAVIASSATELDQRLSQLLEALDAGEPPPARHAHVFLGRAEAPPRIGFLFPGQGGKVRTAAEGALHRRFPAGTGDDHTTGPCQESSPSAAWTQAAIISWAVKSTRLLAGFGISPSSCLGHSLGEIPALHAAGALSAEHAIKLGWNRGHLMDGEPRTRGQMRILFAGKARSEALVNGHAVSFAAYNSTAQTVITGTPEAVDAVARDARSARVATTRLPVDFAFHSPSMKPIEKPFLEFLEQIPFTPPRLPLYSTVTGGRLPPATDLPRHLAAQLTLPVRFHEAYTEATRETSLWIEIGTGTVLADLTGNASVLPLELENPSLVPFLRVLASAFTHGAGVDFQSLHQDRSTAPFDLDWRPHFITNPCERPLPHMEQRQTAAVGPAMRDTIPRHVMSGGTEAPPGSPIRAAKAAIAWQKGDGISASDIRDDQRLGPELGLDSLGLVELEAAVRKQLGGTAANGKVTKLMTVAEFAALFPSGGSAGHNLSDLLHPWVRAFEIGWLETPQLPAPPHAGNPIRWRSIGIPEPGAPPEPAAPENPARHGLMIHAAADPGQGFIQEMLHALNDHPPGEPVAFIDAAGHLSGLARSFSLERPETPVLLCHHPDGGILSGAQIDGEFRDEFQFREILRTADGRRSLPLCRPKPWPSAKEHSVLTPADVVLVTGGAKGITAECLIALAPETDALFILLGRSPATDPAVALTLRRLAENGVRHQYHPVDLTDTGSTSALLQAITDPSAPVTAIIHGAGEHHPGLISSLTAEDIAAHSRAKEDGLRHLLSILDPRPLKWVAAFGSLIARSGYPGSAAYAFANDRLARLMRQHQSQHPHARWLTLDWSAWGDTGMGAALGAIPAMERDGLDPIRTADGVSMFLETLRQADGGERPIITGRLPAFPTLPPHTPPLESLPGDWKIISRTPGVELVVEIPVSLVSHPYLAGHAIDGKIILPGVQCLQWLEKAARALLGTADAGCLRNACFHHPIPLPPSGELRLLVQALMRTDGTVKCWLAPRGRSLRDSPAVSADIRTPAIHPDLPGPFIAPPPEHIPHEDGTRIAREVYDRLLFHTDGFRKIGRYSAASAKACTFHPHDNPAPPPGLDVMADLQARDAFIHGIQICVPAELLLPARVSSIQRFAPAHHARTIIAREISCGDGTYVYDLDALDESGAPVEHWRGLTMTRYRSAALSPAAHPLLQAIHQERAGIHEASGSPPSPPPKRYYEYRHTVGFKETNLVGNVYFTNHIEWQGRCREMFLRDHAPQVLEDLQAGRLALVTVSCSCEYLAELQPFDELAVRMTLEARGEDWASMRFDYWRESPGPPIQVATGRQKISSRRRGSGGLRICAMPCQLATALQHFAR